MTATTLTYECPNCSAGLVFSPEKGKLCCEFCLSEFTEEELSATAAARKAEEEAAKATERLAEEDDTPDDEFSSHLGEYQCSACGAEVLCDDTTAATFCPYCHNPVILGGRLSGQMKPHKVIPFQFDKKEAERRFLTFASKKRFVPRDFISAAQVEKITGIYYPFWVTDADAGADMTARATKVRTWRAGEYRYTETSRYRIHRAGEIHFEDIVTPAITEEDKEMLDGILPYPSDSLEEFTMPRLQGFLVKKRNVEKESICDAVHTRMGSYSQTLLLNTVKGYSSVIPNPPRVLTRRMNWDYTLMPIWLMTYLRHGKKYTFAMNGHTGKVYGQLPVSGKRLAVFGALIGLITGAAAALISFL